MQQIPFFLRATSTMATIVDAYNQKTADTVPAITRGMQAELILQLFKDNGAFAASELPYVSWDFCADKDYDTGTPPKLRATTGITVDAGGKIHIVLANTNTAELVAYLGTETVKTLKCELVGFVAGDTTPAFILQFELAVINRIGGAGTGTPEPVGDGCYSAAQVNALVGAHSTIEYSADGENWHGTCEPGDISRRWKSSVLPAAEWNVEALPQGRPGADGVTWYYHVAYAADSEGVDFSLTPSDTLRYRAEFRSAVRVDTPTVDDLAAAGAVWVKYLGNDGRDGTGDMTKQEYDPDGDGQVDHAKAAGSVPWGGVTDPPETYPPAAHRHVRADLSDPPRQRKIAEAAPNTLYLSADILENSVTLAGPTLTINFTGIMTAPDGENYTVRDGDVFTWEYWVTATAGITAVVIGGSASTMQAVRVPETLELIEGAERTKHVFAVRGIYKSGAENNLMLEVSYAYSAEA